MAKKNKFGSPYDPRYSGGGKVEKPQQTPKLRGCGDPNCPMCNPDTAGQGLPSPDPGTRTGRFSGGGPVEVRISGTPFSGFTPEMLAQARERIMRGMQAGVTNSMEDRMRRAFGFNGGYISGPFPLEISDESEPAGPPASYKKAREAVEDYIVPAPEQSFDDIVGNEDALATLKDAITAPVEHAELYAAYGMKMPKGALLSGPPGCGKTMFAKAAVSEMKRLYGAGTEFLSISGTEIQSPYVGVTEGYITALFNYAREYKAYHGHPLLIFIDEADALLPDRTGRVRRVASWEESQVATFLAEMDGMQESGAFVLLATNRPDTIDQAVLRDGRCDFKITVQRPTHEAIKVILAKNFAGVNTKVAVDDLVFAAHESLIDPAKVIVHATAFEIDVQGRRVRDLKGKDFCLEHIVSGAMAASVPARAVRYAFNRDKTAGKVSGVTVDDVLRAVNGLFQENANLDHQFAIQDFLNEFAQEVEAQALDEGKRKMN